MPMLMARLNALPLHGCQADPAGNVVHPAADQALQGPVHNRPGGGRLGPGGEEKRSLRQSVRG